MHARDVGHAQFALLAGWVIVVGAASLAALSAVGASCLSSL